VPAANFLLQQFHFARKKLDGTAALGTNHVVMAAPVVLVFVACDAVVKGHFAGQSTFGQQLQGAVDRGVADSSVFFLHQPVQFIRRKMVARIEKRAQNRVPLRCLLQANPLEMTMENVLRLVHHLARDGGLVIDALLQHERPE